MSSFQNIYTGVPQGSVLGTHLFLVCINDLPVGLTLMCKIFADDTSLFSKIIDKNNLNSQFNCELEKISKWSFQWKIYFNPDPNKQAIEFASPINAIKKTICLCNLTVQMYR